jgi:hypothetical protein
MGFFTLESSKVPYCVDFVRYGQRLAPCTRHTHRSVEPPHWQEEVVLHAEARCLTDATIRISYYLSIAFERFGPQN